MPDYKLSAVEEQGSIPIALMAIIALTAVVGALVTATVGGTRGARFDQQYTEIIQVADATAQTGAQQLLRAKPPSELEGRAVGYTYTGTYVADGASNTWTATKRDQLLWEVVGTATSTGAAGVDPVTREVSIELRDRSRFFVGAFSDTTLRLRGGNAASSYDIGSGDPLTSSTGNGIVASNGTIRMSGNTDVDGVELYNFGALPQYSRCDGKNQAGQCADLLNGVAPSRVIDQALEIGPDKFLDTGFIDTQKPSCGTLTDFAPAGNATLGTNGQHTVLCYNNFNVSKQSTLTINGTVEIYLYGTLSVGNASVINCAGCAGGTPADSTKLKIYSDGGPVQFGNHTFIGAAIYAPESDCGGNPSNSQSEIFGSLICREISNQGGWAFRYDDQLLSQGAGDYRLDAWREE